MKMLKPKEIARRIGIEPSKVTILAKDIENANLHTFTKTTFGSFLFKEFEVELLKEYHQTIYFLGKKKIALDMIEQRIDFIIEKVEERPYWTKFLQKSVFR